MGSAKFPFLCTSNSKILNWKIKAYIQKAFDVIPGGDHLNYLAQKHITKGLPVNDDVFEEKIGIAKLHFHTYTEFAGPPSKTSHFLEFGSGWDMIIPLTFYCLGIEQQTLVDVKHHLKEDLILNTAERLTEYFEKKKGVLLRKPARIPENESNLRKKMEKHWSINYKAPLLIQQSDLPSESVDCVTSTSVLEHIPAKDILAILQECNRILKKGGIMSCIIDYKDHYAYFDPGISIYNFLQFSEPEWKKYNHYQQYQNRLRHNDYLNIIHQTNFEILQITPTLPSESDLEKLRDIKIAQTFSKFSEEELAVQLSHIVLKKS